jgi:hypothetical protein
MRDELKPCPFCGQPAETTIDSRGETRARCANTDCVFRPGEYDDFWQGTLEEWNTRPIEDALRAEVAAIPYAKIREIAEDYCGGREWCSDEEIDSVNVILAWCDANAPKEP